jgi:hypothetical protein
MDKILISPSLRSRKNGIGSAIGGTALGAILGGNSNRYDLCGFGLKYHRRLFISQKRRDIDERSLADQEGLCQWRRFCYWWYCIGDFVGLLAQGAIDEIGKLFSREPEPLGAIGQGLLGTGVGLVGSLRTRSVKLGSSSSVISSWIEVLNLLMNLG